MSKDFITGNLFLGDESAIKRFGRPFSSVNEMDYTIIRNWNRVVGEDDFVMVLGNMFSNNTLPVSKYRSFLNGAIVYIDLEDSHCAWFADCKEEKEVNGQPIMYYDDTDECIVKALYSRVLAEEYIDGVKKEILYMPVPDSSLKSKESEIIIAGSILSDRDDYYCCATDTNNFTPVTISQLLARDPKETVIIPNY